ncbi:MAG: hypothetical protein DRP79_09000 [Planctomycetota bacterium]|nr:MAG: hypothetical protein DRP79_09000 [Planctomycetota bacterium]
MEHEASILVSLCNRPDYLRELLEHFGRQSFDMSRVELILVDDSGPENYHRQQAVVEDAHGRYPFTVRYFTTGLPLEVYGNPVARNIGLRNASSPLIICTDDDCLPHINMVERHVAAHTGGERLMVAGVRVNDTAKISQPLPVEIDDKKSRRFLEKQERGELGAGAFFGANVSVRKEDLEWVGGWNEKMSNPYEYGHTDRELGMRLLGSGLKFIVDPGAVIYHRPTEKEVEEFRDVHRSREKSHARFKRIQRIYKTKRVLSAPLRLIPGVGRILVRNILRP